MSYEHNNQAKHANNVPSSTIFSDPALLDPLLNISMVKNDTRNTIDTPDSENRYIFN